MEYYTTSCYGFLIGKPDEFDEVTCKVCGKTCNVERSLHGPTSWIDAMTRSGHWHDKFTCPNYQQPWHERAHKLIMKISESPSKRMAELMRLDLEEILHEHGCSYDPAVFEDEQAGNKDISVSHAAIIALQQEMKNDIKFQQLCIQAGLPWKPEAGYEPRWYNGPAPETVQVLFLIAEPGPILEADKENLRRAIDHTTWLGIRFFGVREYEWHPSLLRLCQFIWPEPHTRVNMDAYLGGSCTFWMSLPHEGHVKAIPYAVESYFVDTYLKRFVDLFPNAIILAAGDTPQERLDWIEVDYVPCAAFTRLQEVTAQARESWEWAGETIAQRLAER